jgi:hypothetical protein
MLNRISFVIQLDLLNEQSNEHLVCNFIILFYLLINFLRFLDAIYEQSNQMEPTIHEWRHSADKINISSD